MPTTIKRNSLDKFNGATIGFEEKLWAAADKLRALSAMRDGLLLRLMSGQVMVSVSG
ncbi:MAG TPA: hypothetical protein VF352_01660 [Anaerolineales bacterium]